MDRTLSAVDRPLNPWQVTTSSREMLGKRQSRVVILRVMYKDRPGLQVDSEFNTLRSGHKMILEPIHQGINREL